MRVCLAGWYGLRAPFAALLVVVLLAACGSAPKETEVLAPEDDSELARIEALYGAAARARVERWQALVGSEQLAPEPEKLARVNDFINQFEFVDDIDHWGRNDYWATPLETVVTNGGDCEDFTIAKYFTLKSLAVPEERMRLTYVKALSIDQSHMVLTYFSSPAAEPLVLDNLVPIIQPASMRTDLVPVYSFNAENLWLARQRAEGELVGTSERLGPWRDLLRRMDAETELEARDGGQTGQSLF